MKVGYYYTKANSIARIGLTVDDLELIDLTSVGIHNLSYALEGLDPFENLRREASRSFIRLPVSDAILAAPVNNQEIWAAGVTYLRSKAARMEESDFSATAYDRVYEAARPEIFFKALGSKVVGPGPGRHPQRCPLERARAGVSTGLQPVR